MAMSDCHRYLPPRSLLEIDRLTRRAKHRQNGIIEKGRSSSREAAGFYYCATDRALHRVCRGYDVQ